VEASKMKAKIAITIETEILEKVDKMAEEFNLNRSQFIESLVSVGLADAKLLKKTGFVDMAKLVIRLRDKLDKRLSRVRQV
jgi:metal-responsive CopG/Arc/MetJ family transcriptional regulator